MSTCVNTESIKAFSASHVGLPVTVHKMERVSARTVHCNWPGGCPTPYDVGLSIESWGKDDEGGMFRVVAFFFPVVTLSEVPTFLEI